MALKIYDTLAPQGSYPAVKAEAVEMPDGTRLSEFEGGKGNDGLTPYIGSNGNWWIGEYDTGLPSRGQKGDKGDKGDTGATGATGPIGNPGSDGKDGVSPVVTITTITGGHRITITDATGTKTFDVMDGEDGQGASITLDTTLSKAGQAADAGAVGTAIQQAMQTAGLLINACVKSVNGTKPDANGNVNVEVGASITVDSALSATSENPLQNKVIAGVVQQVTETVQMLSRAIPSDTHINSLIDAYLSEALGGDY